MSLKGIQMRILTFFLKKFKGWIFLKTKKTVIKDLLPTMPIDIDIEHWWTVHVGFVSEEDIKVNAEFSLNFY